MVEWESREREEVLELQSGDSSAISSPPSSLSPSPEFSSPPAPSPSHLAPDSSPTPSGFTDP